LADFGIHTFGAILPGLAKETMNRHIGYPDIADFWRHQRLRKVLLSKDNGFLDEIFGNEREIVREPGVDPAFERANPGDSFWLAAAAPHGRQMCDCKT
jgi:hypothetical protein